jgi:transcriptional regulator with XRE-family HTH domain
MAPTGRPWAEDPDLRAAVDRVRLHISRDLAARREHHFWSHEALGKVSGVHPNLISRLEKTTVDPKLSTLVRVYYAMGWYVDLRTIAPPPLTVGKTEPSLNL